MNNYSNYTEKELLFLLQNDDVKAFDCIYWKYNQAIYRNVLKIVKNIEESENLLQEVFFTLWDKRQSLDIEKPVNNWLFVVSYNKSITYIKKSLNEKIASQQLEPNFLNNDDDDSLRIKKESQFKILEEAISMLSPQKRKVFELCKNQGKTYEQSAIELGISKHTVKEYLSDSIKAIKKYADEHPENLNLIIYLIIVFRFKS